MNLGNEMYSWATDLFPICRSITGPGVRKTLGYIKNILPELKIKEVRSGTKVFDWVIPNEWFIQNAYIKDKSGNTIIDFKDNNLHVMGYSAPITGWFSLEELDKNLHSLPNQPNAIPYITSYYKENWGFCITHNQRKNLKAGKYEVVIDSELRPGVLNYGELILPGEEKDEIFISTYVCHPSMANNELSGPVVATALARWINNQIDRRYTYRFIFIPETIGAINYLSSHHKELKKNVITGFNLTCVGDDRKYSFMPSINGNTLADKLALYVFKSNEISFDHYNFLDRGSDERQYCWPGIDLPIVSIMRSKYGTYPEYHTSDDNLSLISPGGLLGSLELHMECIKVLEINYIYESTSICEPNLGRRGLRPVTSTLLKKEFSINLVDFLIYCDGSKSVLDICIIINKPIDYVKSIIDILIENRLIKKRN
jgi:aminopeptidase-like protein